MRRFACVVLVLAGCNKDVEHEAIAATPAPAADAPAARVEGRPHSANIREVAATEQGDAAVSLDLVGGLRVWTALDGTKEPVPISAPAPTQIAVAGTAFEVIVAVLDQAGSAHVLRFSRDGALRGRTQVAGDVPIIEIVALGDHLLALRADQSLEELDGAGAVRSRLAADPGERIATIAVRAGGVIAVIAGDDGMSNVVRWIEHTDRLAWGQRTMLPAAIDPASVALSPSHRLLAAAEAKSHQMFVYDLSVQPALATSTDVQLQPGEPVGFVDDHDVAALSPVRWWTIGKKETDPWAPTTPPNPMPASTMAAGAAANGVVVSGAGPALALVTGKGTRYLGWAEMNPTTSALVGDRIAITTSGHHYAWLDRALVETRTGDLTDENAYGQPIGDHQVITERALPKGGLAVQLVDFDHVDHPVNLGTFDNVQRLEYEPHTQVLFIDDGAWLHRYRVDLARDAVTEVDKTKLAGETFLYVLDPAVAGGAVAIAGTFDNATTTLDELRDEGGKLVRKKLRTYSGFVASIDARSGVWWRERGGGPIHHGDTTFPAADTVVPDHAGAGVLLSDPATLALFDASGKERWRVPAWRAYSIELTADDRQVLVRGLGGLVMLDAATGERVATACGWRFGIYDRAPDATAAGADSVCEDSGR